MMFKFCDWFLLREEREEKEITNLFDKTTEEINILFNNLIKAINRSFGPSIVPLPEKFKSELVSDLRKVIEKVGKTRTESYKTIENLINEAESIITGLTPSGQGPNEKPVYKVSHVLNNVKQKILDSIHKLRDEMLMRKVHAVGKQISKKIAKLPSELIVKTPAGITTGEEAETARYNLKLLGDLIQRSLGRVNLYSGKIGTRSIQFNPADEKKLDEIINKAKEDRMFRIRIDKIGGAKEIPLDIAHEGSVTNVISTIKKFLNLEKETPLY